MNPLQQWALRLLIATCVMIPIDRLVNTTVTNHIAMGFAIATFVIFILSFFLKKKIK